MIAHAERANAANEDTTVTAIQIMDQIAWDLLPAAGCRQLVGNPFRAGMSRHCRPWRKISSPYSSRNVHRRDTIRVIVQEGIPALRGRSSPSRHVPANAGLPYVDAKLDEFAMYARCAPPRIGSTAESRPAPRDGPAGVSTSSASNGGNPHGAVGPRYQAGRWPALRGSSETAGRPSPEPSCQRLEMAHDRACPVAAR
jgi:hypothetical protein